MWPQNTKRKLTRQDVLRAIAAINVIGELDQGWDYKLMDAINEVREVESNATDGKKEIMYRRISCFLSELQILHDALTKNVI